MGIRPEAMTIGADQENVVTARSEPKRAADTTARRPRGRPRLDIDRAAVAEAVGELFAAGGYEAVSIGSTAEKLNVSRATLYRSVPTKEDLLGVLFERGTAELTEAAQEIIRRQRKPGAQLLELVRIQVDAAIRMRRYMGVFFGGAGMPPDVFDRWHYWSRAYEAMWVKSVTSAMKAGVLADAEPVVTTRLILGMCLWVSRWYRPAERYDADTIKTAAVRLLGLTGEDAPEPATRSRAAAKAAKTAKAASRPAATSRAGGQTENRRNQREAAGAGP
jgi:AcrR family transcriptional regulator